MKPFALAAGTPADCRRFVRLLAFFAPVLFTTTASAQTWTATDIGNTGAAGSEASAPRNLPPAFQMNASGADIQGTADSFRLMSTPASGDVVAVARVDSMTNTHPWAKAGVMIRASLAANSANVAMVISPAACSFQVRSASGAATDVVLGPRVPPPYWVKLTRTGNTFTGHVSPDGVTWTFIASREVILPAQVSAGFAACAHGAGLVTNVNFSAADVNGSSVPPPAPTNVTIADPSPHSAEVTWTDNSTNEEGFRVYLWRHERHATYPEIVGTTPANATSFTLTGLGSESWYYVYVSAYRGGTETASATTSFGTPQDPAEPPGKGHAVFKLFTGAFRGDHGRDRRTHQPGGRQPDDEFPASHLDRQQHQ